MRTMLLLICAFSVGISFEIIEQEQLHASAEVKQLAVHCHSGFDSTELGTEESSEKAFDDLALHDQWSLYVLVSQEPTVVPDVHLVLDHQNDPAYCRPPPGETAA